MKQKVLSCLLVFICLVPLFTGITGCIKEEEETINTFKIGVLLGFSGVGSQNALETKAALEIGLLDIKNYIKRNGLKTNVELIFEDTHSDTLVAKAKTQSLIDEGIQLIIGPYSSAEAKAVKSVADKHQVLIVTHSAVSTSLAIPDDHLLRFVPNDTYQAEALNAMLDLDTIEAMVAVVRNDLWANSLMEASGNLFTAHGGDIIATIPFDPVSSDLSIVANDAKTALATGTATYGAGRTALYLISFGEGTGVLEALHNANLTTQHRLYGSSAFAQHASLTANATAAAFTKNTFFQCPVFGFDEGAADLYEPLQERIKDAIGHKASIYALSAHDILWVAFLTNITLNPESGFDVFKKHFITTANTFSGATGSTKLDENGDRKHVYYDFWSVKETQPGTFEWYLSAKYSTMNKAILKYP